MKYIGFPPMLDADSIAVGIERIEDITDEMRELHAQHYAETETLYLDTPFSPDYARYIALEQAKQFVLFTVRYGVELVGYLQYYVYRDLHTSDVYQAREDAFFITKQHRGRRIAPRLLAFAETCLRQLGCRYVGMSSKGPVGGPDIGPFLEKNGYCPVAIFYSKDLESQ